MGPTRFDTLARLLAASGSRRRLLGGLLAGALGIGAASEATAAGCRSSGGICREGANCCSGLCGLKDRAGRRRCICPLGTKSCKGTCIPTGTCCTSADCPATGNECVARTCVGGVCGTRNLGAEHTLSTGQTAGDCQKIVCNGAGGTTSIDDPMDIPTSSTACRITPACTGSPLTPSFTAAPTGTDCTNDNDPPNQVCGDTTDLLVAGTCVECNVDAECLDFCSNHTCETCLVAGTQVAMADGTTRPIETIEVGDMVLGRYGGANRVVVLDRPLLGPRMLYSFNEGRYFVTSEHRFMTEDGWKAVDPAATAAENPALVVGRLAAGDRLLTLAAVAVPVAAGGIWDAAEALADGCRAVAGVDGTNGRSGDSALQPPSRRRPRLFRRRLARPQQVVAGLFSPGTLGVPGEKTKLRPRPLVANISLFHGRIGSDIVSITASYANPPFRVNLRIDPELAVLAVGCERKRRSMNRVPLSLGRSLRLGAIVAFAALAVNASGGVAQTPVADESHPAHIHAGTCATLGDVVLPLTDVADPAAAGAEWVGAETAHTVKLSRTDVAMPLEEIVAGEYAVNVHLSSEEIGTYIACGDIGGHLLEDEGRMHLIIGLGELNDSGHTGSVWFGSDGEQTEVVITPIEPDEMA